MKRISLILTLLILGLTFVTGQTSSDSVKIKKVFGGYQFFQGDKRLNMSKLVKIMEPNEQAYKQVKAAQSTNAFASIFAFAGGFMVGWPIGTAIAGGEPNWALAGIGAGLIVVSIPISQKFNKQVKSAVETYNGGLKTSSFWDTRELRFSINANGVGFGLRF